MILALVTCSPTLLELVESKAYKNIVEFGLYVLVIYCCVFITAKCEFTYVS